MTRDIVCNTKNTATREIYIDFFRLETIKRIISSSIGIIKICFKLQRLIHDYIASVPAM